MSQKQPQRPIAPPPRKSPPPPSHLPTAPAYTPSAIAPAPSPAPAAPPTVPRPKQSAAPSPFTPPRVPPTPAPSPLPSQGKGGAPPAAPRGIHVPLKKRSQNGLISLIIAALVVVAAGGIGYFVVFPLFFSSPPNPVPAPPPPSETVDVPEIPPAVSEEPGTEAVPTDEAPGLPGVPPADDEGDDEVVPVVPPVVIPVHTSFFTTPADITSDVILDTVDVASFRGAFAFTTASQPSLQEAVAKDSSGAALTLAQFGPGLLPSFFTDALHAFFLDDFTLAVYTDSAGSWPVYVLKRADGVSASDAETAAAALESLPVAELGNLYLTGAGDGGTWKDGGLAGQSARYVSFSQSGAALSYAWLGEYLIIATNYSGAQEAANHLGF